MVQAWEDQTWWRTPGPGVSFRGDWKIGCLLIVPLLPDLEYLDSETWPEPFDETSQSFGPFGPYKLECWRGLSCAFLFWRTLDASLIQT